MLIFQSLCNLYITDHASGGLECWFRICFYFSCMVTREVDVLYKQIVGGTITKTQNQNRDV